MIGPWLFAGRRWVATRDLKDLRFPDDTPFAPDRGRRLVRRRLLAARRPLRRAHRVGDRPGQLAVRERPRLRGPHARAHRHVLPRRALVPRRRPGAARARARQAESTSGWCRSPSSATRAWARSSSTPGSTSTSPPSSPAARSRTCRRGQPAPLLDSRAGVRAPRPRRRPAAAARSTSSRTTPAPTGSGSAAGPRRSTASGSCGTVVLCGPWIPTIIGTDTYTDQLW